jgi:hypothetical protein
MHKHKHKLSFTSNSRMSDCGARGDGRVLRTRSRAASAGGEVQPLVRQIAVHAGRSYPMPSHGRVCLGDCEGEVSGWVIASGTFWGAGT